MRDFIEHFRFKLTYLSTLVVLCLIVTANIVMAQETVPNQPTVEELWRQEESRIGNLEKRISEIDLQIANANVSDSDSAVQSAQIRRQRSEIIDLYTQIIDNSPLKNEIGFSSYYVARGVYYSEDEQWEKAIADLNTALIVNSNDLFALKDRAIINREAGNLAASLADFKLFLANVEKLEIKDSWNEDITFAREQIESLEALVSDNQPESQDLQKIYLPLISAAAATDIVESSSANQTTASGTWYGNAGRYNKKNLTTNVTTPNIAGFACELLFPGYKIENAMWFLLPTTTSGRVKYYYFNFSGYYAWATISNDSYYASQTGWTPYGSNNYYVQVQNRDFCAGVMTSASGFYKITGQY